MDVCVYECLTSGPNTWVKSEKWAMLLNSVNILLMSGRLANVGGDDQVILAKGGLLAWGLD